MRHFEVNIELEILMLPRELKAIYVIIYLYVYFGLLDW